MSSSTSGGCVLALSHVTKRFGGVLAVDGFSMDTTGYNVIGLIGPNGAGKTTVFNILTGIVTADAGLIRWNERDITNAATHTIARMGIQRTFQNIRLFTGLPVLDNVAAGAIQMRGVSLKLGREQARDLLIEVGYKGRIDARPAELPYAFQRRVEIARALAAQPKLLLLDEPAAGMHANERDDLAELIQGLHARGVTVLLVEHDIALVSNVCDHVIVMDFGRTIAQGSPAEVVNDSSVIEAYLGGAA